MSQDIEDTANPGARTIVLDIGHADLLRAPQVHELVTDLLTGGHPW